MRDCLHTIFLQKNAFAPPSHPFSPGGRGGGPQTAPHPWPAQPRCSGFSSNTPPGTSYAACAAWASRPTRRGCAWTAFARRCVDPPPKSRNAPRRRKHTAERRTRRARPETSVYFLSRPVCGRAASARATARLACLVVHPGRTLLPSLEQRRVPLAIRFAIPRLHPPESPAACNRKQSSG